MKIAYNLIILKLIIIRKYVVVVNANQGDIIIKLKSNVLVALIIVMNAVVLCIVVHVLIYIGIFKDNALRFVLSDFIKILFREKRFALSKKPYTLLIVKINFGIRK